LDLVKWQKFANFFSLQGPLIEANWGDWFEITVINDLADEGTTIHWHGLRQAQSPEMDGVPSLSQCPIAPGQSFTYRFQAEVYGSSWYHSHYVRKSPFLLRQTLLIRK